MLILPLLLVPILNYKQRVSPDYILYQTKSNKSQITKLKLQTNSKTQ
ncbi:hypothetical protein D1AOALGA4SA_5665 [Olavius algarvensis Delta 1 endosymbiont]|nr:hypothetical protein D1AOALGA4SA_5665 [Olavius algarvensis Delta 1 endosymbiont]